MAAQAFLQRLGLDADADARAIRHAYARELKLIDQARDPRAFQDLRECYETALAWAAPTGRARMPHESPAHERAAPADPVSVAEPAPPSTAPEAPAESPAESAPESAPAPAPAPRQYAQSWTAAAVPASPVPVQVQAAAEPSQAAVGRLVFDLLRMRLPALASGPAASAEADHEAALQAALADERLLNFDARLGFERQLAQLLAGGWQRGHEVLLPVAARLFGWDRDRRTLARLGAAGETLDRALEERAGFAAQEAPVRSRQRDVLALLRAATAPSAHTVMSEMPALEQLMARFPHWMALIAPMTTVHAWRSHYRERKGRSFEMPDAAGPMPARTPEMGRVVKLLNSSARYAIFGLLALLASFILFQSASLFKGRRADGESAQAYAERLRHPQPIYKDEPVPEGRIDEIAGRIRYRPGPRVKPAVQRATFEVFLDENGAVIGVNRKGRAADPAYTAAVEKAILATPPFPPRTVKIFTVGYTADGRRGAAPPRVVRAPTPAGSAGAAGDRPFRLQDLPQKQPQTQPQKQQFDPQQNLYRYLEQERAQGGGEGPPAPAAGPPAQPPA